LGLPQQDNERGGEEGVQDVAGALEQPANDDDGEHDGGADAEAGQPVKST